MKEVFHPSLFSILGIFGRDRELLYKASFYLNKIYIIKYSSAPLYDFKVFDTDIKKYN